MHFNATESLVKIKGWCTATEQVQRDPNDDLYNVHPCLLDSVLQSPTIMMVGGDGLADFYYIPTSLDKARIASGLSKNEDLWVHCTLVDWSKQGFSCNIEVWSSSSSSPALLCALTGMSYLRRPVKETDESQAVTSFTEHFETVWQPMALPYVESLIIDDHGISTVCTSDAFSEAISSLLTGESVGKDYTLRQNEAALISTLENGATKVRLDII
ncbi:hypothetical protein L7F22_049593 [Adiantum nelumboides]|nr:hypothetical protein [Adiantum nelumboides]